MSVPRLPLTLGLVLLLGASGGAILHHSRDKFDHEKHAKVFPNCTGCHAGILEAGRPLFPAAEICANCHDGTVEKKVDWTAPPAHTSNLRFAHAVHIKKSGEKLPADSAIACPACHTPAGAGWLTIRRTIPRQCLDCHGVKAVHFAAPDTACGTCHFPLAEATKLSEAQIAKFDKPTSHEDPAFLTSKGHADLARHGDRTCTVCHARDFCMQCHVNAPEVKAIQALALDPRSLALKVELKAPASHKDSRWLTQHGGKGKRDPATCATCHTQESCMTCHRTRPPVVMAMPDSGPGRAIGARIERRQQGYHAPGFADSHASQARSVPNSCSACHARQECLECHRPNPGATRGYHPAGFLTRHPAAAYGRQSDCSECHNSEQFCTTCHKQSGLTSKRPLQGGYHDANGAVWLLQHGPSARRQLESCVTCHTERDCLFCHSAQTRSFDPHGPGFDADRLRRRNPQMCSACHGRNIPGN
jgi:hypothetical protein